MNQTALSIFNSKGMIHFLKKIAVFVLLALLLTITYFSVIIYINQHKQDSTTKWISERGENLSGFNYYVFGNSHPECAINDSTSVHRLRNLANSGEPLFYSVAKMRRIADQNPKATFIVEVGNHALNAIHWVLSDEHLFKNYAQYFYDLRTDEHEFVIANNPSKALKTIISLSPNSASSVIQGSYNPLKQTLVEYYRKKVTISSNEPSNQDQPSSSNLDAQQYQNVQSLINFIEAYPHIHIIIIRCPVHPSVQASNEEEYLDLISELTSKYAVQFADFKDSLPSNEFYADPEHLNIQGSQKFTKQIDAYLIAE